jgi:uncharacterized membrane protein
MLFVVCVFQLYCAFFFVAQFVLVLFITQELFKVSTTAGTRRVKKGSSVTETTSPSNQSSKESTLAQKAELDRSWEENVAESVANELVSQIQGQSNAQTETQDAAKDAKLVRSARSTREEKKPVEPNEVKQSRPQKMMDFRNIKISQVGIYVLFIEHSNHSTHLLKQLSFVLNVLARLNCFLRMRDCHLLLMM